MNKTKRKIFETSMKLFSEKGYDATSIEEITAVVGVAKGTLYYHFSSKEEIFNFLVDEGMKLLKNSIEIKTSKFENAVDKLEAVSLVQLKIIKKYESLIDIVLSQLWGSEKRNKFCQEKVEEYISVIEKIVDDGIKKGDIKNCNSKILSTEIFSLISSIVVYKNSSKDEEFDIMKLYEEYNKNFFENLRR